LGQIVGWEILKSFASNFSEAGIKTFNDKMKELLFVYDEDLVGLCSYVNKELYYKLMQLSISKWESDTEAEIAELSIPVEQE
jgi:hypothetical protein